MPKFPFTNYHELNLDWILKKVETLFNASEENARTIRTYDTRLNSAEQTATSAATAATSAQQLADAAAATADNALSVAGTANAKADSALTAATNAAGAVSGALTIAQEAQQNAAAAVATANDAAATASSLESLANTANQNATAAVETAGTAVTKANNAAAAAQTADQKAVAAQQTANSAQAAASINAGNISTLQTNVTDLNRQISELSGTVSLDSTQIDLLKGNNPYTVKDNYYITETGAEGSSGIYELYIADVIPGTTVFGTTGNSSNGTGYLAFYDSNDVLIGTPKRNPVAESTVYHFSEIVPDNAAKLKVTNRKSWNVAVNISTGNISKYLCEVYQEIQTYSPIIQNMVKTKTVFFDYGTAGFINSNGVLTAHSDYYNVDIKVNTGEIININTYSVTDAVAVFSQRIGKKYIPLLIADTNQRKTYSYKADKNMIITVSYLNATKSGNITYTVNADNVNLLNTQKTPNYAEMFHTVGIIGDSLASGEIAYTDNGTNVYIDKYDFSWLSNFCRNCGTLAKYYSKGGMTAKTWLEDSGGMRSTFENDTACNAYFIALGTNDITSGIDIGTISDESGSNSFVGYIKQIISVVHSKAPNAVIFIVSTYANHSVSRTWSRMLCNISTLYNYCYYVDFIGYSDIFTDSASPIISLGHFTTPAYVNVGKTINEAVNDIVNANYSEFALFAVNN